GTQCARGESEKGGGGPHRCLQERRKGERHSLPESDEQREPPHRGVSQRAPSRPCRCLQYDYFRHPSPAQSPVGAFHRPRSPRSPVALAQRPPASSHVPLARSVMLPSAA